MVVLCWEFCFVTFEVLVVGLICMLGFVVFGGVLVVSCIWILLFCVCLLALGEIVVINCLIGLN